jgi:3-oxocholest-4-en-26-oate---CoA ligase
LLRAAPGGNGSEPEPSGRTTTIITTTTTTTGNAMPAEFNLADLFELVADTVPDRLALVAGRQRLTYAELDARANRFGHHLLDQEVEPGDFVGILARNRAEWVESMIGCYKARTVPVNLNYRYVAPELRYVVDNADLAALVFEHALVQLTEAALEGASDRGARLVELDGDATKGAAPLGAVPYEEALAAASPERTFGPRSPDDRYVLYTGGTTGMPKGVVWRQEDIFFAAMGGGGWGASPIAEPEELIGRLNPDERARLVMLVVGPLMHGNAQWAMWSTLLAAGTAVLNVDARFDPDALLRAVGDEGVASIALVGDAMARPLAEALADAEEGTYDTSSLVAVGSGGAMLSAAVKEELRHQLPGVLIMDRFGASESGAQGAVDDSATGPRFVMNDETSVLDDELRPLRPGDGRIGRLARTGRIPLGYHKDRANTEATFPTDTKGVRWSVPGDLASVEPDGTITVHGRGSASINSGGEKIFPEEVEAAVKEHPGVFGAIVVGIPDERYGERVAVVVQPRGESEAPTLEELQHHCRERVAGYKIPRELVVVDEVPLTAAGKPDLATARSLFTS